MCVHETYPFDHVLLVKSSLMFVQHLHGVASHGHTNWHKVLPAADACVFCTCCVQLIARTGGCGADRHEGSNN